LLLLQPLAGALLQRQALHQLLHPGLLLPELVLQLGQLPIEAVQLAFRFVREAPFLALLAVQFRQPLLRLAQPFGQLLGFRLQGGDLLQQAPSLLAALPLRLHPVA
jgi:hypothetical protein